MSCMFYRYLLDLGVAQQLLQLRNKPLQQRLDSACFDYYIFSLQKLRLYTTLHGPVVDASLQRPYEGPVYASCQRFD